MLEEKVDLFIGSHDSATREANIATIKGKVAYIYSPVYEGGECSPNVYCLGETPPQQAQPATEFLAKEKGAKTFFLIGCLRYEDQWTKIHYTDLCVYLSHAPSSLTGSLEAVTS